MKKICTLLVFVTFTGLAQASDFITRWDMSQLGSNNTAITFGVNTSGIVNYTWETIPAGTTGIGTFNGTTATISGLPINATIRLKIAPTNFNRININFGGDKSRLKDIEQWGSVGWSTMSSAFYGCKNIVAISAVDVPDLIMVTSMYRMFSSCSTLTGPVIIDTWNVSNVTDMSYLFYYTQFNRDISSWDVGNVTNMSYMFSSCYFNKPIGNWNVSNVTNMSSMFMNSNFNQLLHAWNTGNVTDFSAMFYNNNMFNLTINNWDVSSVTTMNNMFKNASSFNQSLSNWNLSSVTNLANCFDNCGIKCDTYTQTLTGWNNNTNTPNNITLGAIGRQYGTLALADRTNLVTVKGWTINGDAQIALPCEPSEFITIWDMSLGGNPGEISFLLNAGSAEYYWETIPLTATGTFGYGILSGSTIYGLPTSGLIKFKIYNTNALSLSFYLPSSSATANKLIDVTQWGTTKWASTENMFKYCSNMTISATDIPNLSVATSTKGMFYECSSFVGAPNMNSWNMASVTNTSAMFYRDTLFNVPIDNWNTNNVTNMSYMFDSCFAFNQAIGNWNTGNATNLQGMFLFAKTFNQPIGNWNMSSATNIKEMFGACEAFNQPLNSWDVSNATSLFAVFDGCKVFNQPLNNWNISNVTDLSGTFSRCNAFNQNINNWNTNNVTKMLLTFAGCSVYNQPLNNWNTSNVTDMQQMFTGDSVFNQNINVWNTGNVTNMYWMFGDCGVYNLPLDNWNTTNVTNMRSLFAGASVFNQPLNTWNVSNVTNMEYMFGRAYAFNQPLDNWNTWSVTNMRGMFSEAIAFNQSLSTFNTYAVTSMQWMFAIALSFNQSLGNWDLTFLNNATGALDSCGMDCINYSATIFGWNNSINTPNNIILGAMGRQYGTNVVSDRNNLINNKGWTFVGDSPSGIYCSNVPTSEENQILNENEFSLSPNPANNNILVSWQQLVGSKASIKIYNAIGQLLYDSKFLMQNSTLQIDVSSFAKGVYVVEVKENQHIFRSKFVKE